MTNLYPILFLFPFLLFIQQHWCLQPLATAADGFIGINGAHFTLNGAPFYANGFNAYWLMDVASKPCQRSKVTSAFREAISRSLVIARTWAFSDGGSNALQSSPGVYNENMFKVNVSDFIILEGILVFHDQRVRDLMNMKIFVDTDVDVRLARRIRRDTVERGRDVNFVLEQALDFVISEGGKFGVKLILSLVNNFNDYGGKGQYVQWARERGQKMQNEDSFFTNPMVKGFFKNHIKTVLTRRNTITGVMYKDDPTIMAWELMNEPRCPADVSGATVQNWISEMACYLKSIDANHLLEVGLEGFYGASSFQKNPNNSPHETDFIANNQIREVDFATVHSYPDQWLPNRNNVAQLEFLQQWIYDHIVDAQEVLKKPVIFAEFGKSWKQPGYNVSQKNQLYNMVYTWIYRSASGGVASGGLFWQQLVEGMDSYKDGYEVILTEPSSTVRLITQQAKKLRALVEDFPKNKKIKIKNGYKHNLVYKQ